MYVCEERGSEGSVGMCRINCEEDGRASSFSIRRLLCVCVVMYDAYLRYMHIVVIDDDDDDDVERGGT